MFAEYGHMIDTKIKDGVIVNIGKWFYEEGLEKMFSKYYFTAHDFTAFMAKFMIYGLAAIFLAAVCVLDGKDLET